MKVYIVTSGSYSDYGIDGVFLNKEKAELYCKYHQRDWDHCKIEEWETADEYDPKDTYYNVSMTFAIEGASGQYDCLGLLHQPDGRFKAVHKKTTCHLTDYSESTAYNNWYFDRHLTLTRYYREQDYTEEAAKAKVEKIGYDMCAQIIQAMYSGASENDIEKLVKENA